MAYGASSAEDSPDDDSDLSRTCTGTGHKKPPDDDSDLGGMCIATGHRKRPDDNSDLGCTHTATTHRERSASQTAAQRKKGLPAERLLHIPFFHIHHQLTEHIFTLFTYPFFVITHLSNS